MAFCRYLPALAVIALMPLPALGAGISPPSASTTPATLVVVGHADVLRAPNRAVIHAEISTSGRDAAAARRQNDEVTQRVMAALAAAGIAQQAVRTTNFQSSFVPRGKDTPADAVTGYISRRDMNVTTTPSAIEAVTHALNASGVSEIEGILTDVEQRKTAYQETLAVAMQDAELQAQALAHAAHVHIVRVITIEASGAPVFAPRVESMAASAAMPAPPSADVELSATVNVTYEIAP